MPTKVRLGSPRLAPVNGTKFCYGCDSSKSVKEFHRNSKRPDGLATQCKVCSGGHRRRHYLKNLEKTKAQQKKWYAEHREERLEKAAARDRATVNAEARKCYAAKREERQLKRRQQWAADAEFRAKANKYRQENREAVNANLRKRYAEDPTIRRASNNRRRYLERSAGSGVSAAEWRAILACHFHCCAYCLAAGCSLEMDHVVAISRGGAHHPSNVVPACESCNTSKNDHPLEEVLFNPRYAVGRRSLAASNMSTLTL